MTGKIRVRKINEKNEVTYDEFIGARLEFNTHGWQTLFDKVVKCDSGETLCIGNFVSNDDKEIKQLLIDIDRETNPNIYEKI